MQLEPGAIVENRYRIERLVAAHTGVTVWSATDLLQACTVELVLSCGGTMIDVAKVPLRGPQPVLQLVEITDEDAFFEEPPPPELFYAPPPRSKAFWLLGVAAVACAAIGAGVVYTKHIAPRAIAANEEVTITQAVLPIATTATPPPPQPVVATTIVEAPPPAPTPAPRAVVTPKRLPRPSHRAAPPPPPPPLPAHDDPITL